MARASSASTSRFTSGLTSQASALFSKLKQTDGLTWAVLVAIVLYVSVASPANTPTIFRNSLFRFVVFAFVVIVFLVEGHVIGTLFALAMLLPIVYSSMAASQEGFEDYHYNDNSHVISEEDENVYEEDVNTDSSSMEPEVFSFTAN